MKIDLIVPNSLGEVTLGQYKKYIKLEDVSEMELSLKIVEIFCNLTKEQVRLLKFTDVKNVVSIIVKMFDSKPSLVHSFKMDEVEYGFIPNLDEMSFGEYIDLDTNIGDWDNMEKAMGVLYRPILARSGNRYHIKEYLAENTDGYNQMPLDAVFSSILFFYHLGNELCKVTLNSLEEQEVQNLQEYHNSIPNGDGFRASMDYLKKILGDLKISLN